jgi:hypothetical protein
MGTLASSTNKTDCHDKTAISGVKHHNPNSSIDIRDVDLSA